MPRIMITPFEKKSSDSRIQDQYAGWRYTNSRYSMAEIDDYILDVLLRDLVGHDRRPVSFLVFLWLFFEQQRSGDSVQIDRKSTRLNSSHRCISYAVFCLK